MGNKTLHTVTYPGVDDTYYVPVVAAEYDISETYAVGDYCTYQGQIYKCTTAVTVAGSFDANKWTAVNLADQVAAISGDLLASTANLDALINQTARGHMTHIFSPSATGAPNTTWSGFCETLIVSSSYAAQWAYIGSGRIFVRSREGSTIGGWMLVYSNQTVTVTDVNVNSKNIQARMIGNVCYVSGWVTPKAQTYTAGSMALVKLGTAPATRTFFVGASDSKPYGMELTAAGNIVFNSSSPTFSGNPYLYMNFTYITAT